MEIICSGGRSFFTRKTTQESGGDIMICTAALHPHTNILESRWSTELSAEKTKGFLRKPRAVFSSTKLYAAKQRHEICA